jgi:hypothetical protein
MERALNKEQMEQQRRREILVVEADQLLHEGKAAQNRFCRRKN